MKAIILTEDFEIGCSDTEIIPKGTVGLPVKVGYPPEQIPAPNNYHFPTLSGSGPWAYIIPVYSWELFDAAPREDLDEDDPRVIEARKAWEARRTPF